MLALVVAACTSQADPTTTTVPTVDSVGSTNTTPPLPSDYFDRLRALQVGAKALESLAGLFDVPVSTSDAPTGMPTVVIDHGGTRLIAGLWTEAAGWDPIEFVPDAGEATPTPEIRVRLLATMTDDPINPVEVAGSSVRAADLVGRTSRRVVRSGGRRRHGVAGDCPGRRHRRRADHPPGRLRPGGTDPADASALTLDGRLLTEEGPGWVSGSNVFGGSGDPDSVSMVEIRRINAGRFPWVEIDVEVAGESAAVADLPASAFSLSDGDVPRPVLLERARRHGHA